MRHMPQPERGKAGAENKRNMTVGDQPFRNGSKPDLKSVKGLSALSPESGRIGDVERWHRSVRTDINRVAELKAGCADVPHLLLQPL